MFNKQQVTKMQTFNKHQKFRVIAGGTISFYSTAGEIRNGVGDTSKFNQALRKCLNALELQRFSDNIPSCVGLSGTWEGFNVQLDMQQ
jgi:hypothetical protein